MYIDDVTFWGMNIPKEMEIFMKKVEKQSTRGMSERELMFYNLGVKNTISIMEQLLKQSDEANLNSITFYYSGIEGTEELDADDIIKILDKRSEEFYKRLNN